MGLLDIMHQCDAHQCDINSKDVILRILKSGINNINRFILEPISLIKIYADSCC